MNTIKPERRQALPLVTLLITILTLPLLNSCGGAQTSVPPPVDDTRGGTQTSAPRNQPQANKGITNTQKVAILAGAAALYYLYTQHKQKQEEGAQGKYYLSKNGRVYYRDAEHRAHWVTPPPEGIRVPESEAKQYQEFQGYNNSPTGRTLAGIGDAPVPVQ